MAFPPRSASTMSDAIAGSSPSGRMSKRARKAAEQRLALDLFGPNSTREDFTGSYSPAEVLESQIASKLSYAQFLRGLAAKGMGPRKHLKLAEELEAEAAELGKKV